jgi:hypothetical protein
MFLTWNLLGLRVPARGDEASSRLQFGCMHASLLKSQLSSGCRCYITFIGNDAHNLPLSAAAAIPTDRHE